MSFVQYKKIVASGDTVVIYLNRDSMVPLKVDSTQVYNNRFGTFRHADMVGKPYGSKIASSTGKGFIYILHPTPELWTLILPHRTQILYIADISLIITMLKIQPGVKVIESGTGSGSFSHSLARTIAPTGHVYSYEYHEDRANVARKEFEEHQLSEYVTVECRDVCKEGFGLVNVVNAVFLDLPAPWEAIASAKHSFKKYECGKICCFSPCIEQVQKTCAALKKNGFSEIKMFECLIKPFDARNIQVISAQDIINAQLAQQHKRRRLLADRNKLDGKSTDDSGEPESHAPSSDVLDAEGDLGEGNIEVGKAEASRVPSLQDDSEVTIEQRNTFDDEQKDFSSTEECNGQFRTLAKEKRSKVSRNVAKAPAEVRGHTSYLTFATYIPDFESFSKRQEV